MKKVFLKINLILILLSFVTLKAQSNVLVNWKCIPPDSQKVSSQHVNVIGINEVGTSIFRVRSYTGANGPLGPTQRWWPNDGTNAISWGNETEQVNNRYVQFAVTPKSGYIMHADSITMYLGGGSTSYMKVNVAYDTRASFQYAKRINSEPVALLNNVLKLLSFKINKDVYPGDTLYIRVYPWYESTLSNSKYLLVQDVNIYGSTTELTISNSPVNVKLPIIAGTINTEKLAAITVDDISAKNITAIQFTLNYDKNIISIPEVVTTGTLLEGKGILSANADTTNGTVTVAWAGYPPLTGEGSLLKLKIKFKNYGTSNLDFGNTLKFNLGIPGAIVTSGSAKTAAVIVQGGSVTAVAGDNIVIPILTTAITADQKVLSYDFTASFNKDVIEITNYDLESTLSSGGIAAINVNNTTGTVTFSLASGSYITGSGTLLKLTGKAKAAGSTELTFTSFKFNTGTPGATADPAQIVVAEANVAPTLTLNPNQTTFAVNENETLTITLIGADANTGDVLTYSYTATPATTGATLSAAGVFSWKPNFDQAGVYSVTFKVTDKGGLSATKTVAIVVNNVNRPPVFTVEIPNNQVVPVHNVPVTFEFIYKAEDPDGDPLTFRKVSGPGEISTTGLFTWEPVPDQAGKSYILIVEVSDGSLTATSTRTIKVSDTVTGVEEESGIPNEFMLMQNYPNPFNPTTTIKFALPKESHVKLSVYNILGQEVATLVNGIMQAGYHRVNFDATGLNTGMYIYKIQADGFVMMKKMMYVK
ncbi:cohesin domain-containing protein [Ignavibacteria bacterium 4148-Me]|uniref:Ig-like domain-containing protein n=1 Tax=Rosettibacter primus TaxID=3111523 RepID=UPI00336C13B7